MSHDEFIEEFETIRSREGLVDPVVKVELSPTSGDAVAIDLLHVPDPRNRDTGLARRVLDLLLALSDSTGIPLEVIPACVYPGSGALDDEQLRVMYSRRSFEPVPTTDKPKLMRRKPARLIVAP